MQFFNAKDDEKEDLRKPAHFEQLTSQRAKQPTREEKIPSRSFQWFREGDYVHHIETNEGGNINGLFCASRQREAGKPIQSRCVMYLTYKTKRYRVPILHIIGNDRVQYDVHRSFLLLGWGEVEIYAWAKSNLSTVWKDGSAPKAIVTDLELALMTAIAQVFPSSSYMLCVWHTNKNIVAKGKKHYSTQKRFDEFLQMWNVPVSSWKAEK